jgi:hypothetical protein
VPQARNESAPLALERLEVILAGAVPQARNESAPLALERLEVILAGALPRAGNELPCAYSCFARIACGYSCFARIRIFGAKMKLFMRQLLARTN